MESLAICKIQLRLGVQISTITRLLSAKRRSPSPEEEEEDEEAEEEEEEEEELGTIWYRPRQANLPDRTLLQRLFSDSLPQFQVAHRPWWLTALRAGNTLSK